MTRLEEGRSEDETLEVDAGPVKLAPSVGQRLERYVVLEEIGRGGMGRVLRAYDPKLHREVALKVLRTDRFSEDGEARMVREARAMAQLSHPNVVAIYDVELDEPGSVVIAMEYVEGSTLRAWLRTSPRPKRKIIDVFIEAGRGLKAAHDQGLLHRDFKPANVLLGRDGRSRVTDFGLARPSDDEPTGERSTPSRTDGDLERSHDSLSAPLTGYGQVLGTPPYMAPEQHTGEVLTPAADQYAYCIALWEALVGERPFAITGDLARVCQVKLEGPPPFPRTADVPASVAAVIVRGLAPHPDDRWASMSALLNELSRAATPPRRVRWVAAVGLVGLAGAGVAASSHAQPAPCQGATERLGNAWNEARQHAVEQALRASAEGYADRVWNEVSEGLDGYAEAWAQQHEDACLATAVRGEQSSEVLDLRMACLEDARRSLDAASDVLAEADSKVSRRTDRIMDTLPDLARCSDLAALQAGAAPPATEEAEAVAEVHEVLAHASVLRAAGKYDGYSELVAEAQQLADALQYEPLRIRLLHANGFSHVTQGEYEPAAQAMASALELALAIGEDQRARDIAIDLVDTVGRRQSRSEPALAYGHTAMGLLQRQPSKRAEARLRTAIGEVYTELARYDDARRELGAAIDLLTELHGPDDQRLTNAYTAMTAVMQRDAKLREAVKLQRRILAIREGALGPAHPQTGLARVNLADGLRNIGEYQEALPHIERALEDLIPILGDDHPTIASVRNNYAIILRSSGKVEESEPVLRAAIRAGVAADGPDHPLLASYRSNLAHTLGQLGRRSEAIGELQKALQIRIKAYGADHPDVARARSNLGTHLEEDGQVEAALEMHTLAVAGLEAALGPAHPDVATARHNVGATYFGAERCDEAIGPLQAAWTTRRDMTVAHGNRGDTARLLAMCRWDTGEHEQARELMRSAKDAYDREESPRYDDVRAFVRTWLSEHDDAPTG